MPLVHSLKFGKWPILIVGSHSLSSETCPALSGAVGGGFGCPWAIKSLLYYWHMPCVSRVYLPSV